MLSPEERTPPRRRILRESVSAHPWLAAAFIVAGALILGKLVDPATRNAPSTTGTPSSPSAASISIQRGDEVRLSDEGLSVVILARDLEAFEELTTAWLTAKHNRAYLVWIAASLATSGRTLSLNPWTHAIVLETDRSRTRVRVISGEWVGADGWVPTFQLRKP